MWTIGLASFRIDWLRGHDGSEGTFGEYCERMGQCPAVIAWWRDGDERGFTLPWRVRSRAGIRSILNESTARRKFASTGGQVSTRNATR